MRRLIAVIGMIAALSALVVMALPARAASEGTDAIEVCGTLRAHNAATATAEGSLRLGSRTYAIASGVTAGNGGVEVAVGRDLCVAASVGLTSGRIVRYLFFTVLTGDRVCGNIVRPTSADSFALLADFGELTLLRSTSLPIDNPGMRACYAFQVDSASGDLVATAKQTVRDTFSDRERVARCGTVKAYVPATAATSGQITVGSRLFRIAAGTAYTGDPAGSRIDRTTVGQAMCLTSTLDIGGAIVEYVTQEMYTSISATASAYTPPSSSGSGVAILSYVSRYELRIPAAIDAATDIARGTYCFSTTIDASGDIAASAIMACSPGVAAGASTPSPTTTPPPSASASTPVTTATASASATVTASATATPSGGTLALSSPSPAPGTTQQSSPLLLVGIALLAGAAALAVYLGRRSRFS